MIELYWALSMLATGVIAYLYGLGTIRAEQASKCMQLRESLRFVRIHNAELLHEAAEVKGLWATDKPRLIRHHKERELFFRIGYPKDRL